MLGEKYTQINDENKDAVGEICNQIFGFGKKKLNEQGYQIESALPSVIVGNGHEISRLVKGIIITAKFKTEFGWFFVETAMSH